MSVPLLLSLKINKTKATSDTKEYEMKLWKLSKKKGEREERKMHMSLGKFNI